MLSIAICLLSLSAAPRVQVRPAPIFLVLRTAANPAQVKREARLHDEVSLLLDNFAVLSQPVDDPAFQSRSLAEQLKRVLEVAVHNEALGVLWLAEPAKGQLMVHVVGIGTGRALIRTLEFDQRSGSEKALALIVRELLGTAFLQATPGTIDPGLAEVVRDVRRELPKDPLLEKKPEVVAPAPLPQPVALDEPWSASAAAMTGLSLAGAQGRFLSFGAAVRVERAFTDSFHAGLTVEVHSARDLEVNAQVSSLELPFGVTAGFSIPLGHFALVPRLTVMPGWNQLWATNAIGTTVTQVWTLRARAGLGLRTANTKPLQLLVELSVDAVPLRGAARDVATGLDVWKSPWLELNLAAGFFWKG